MQAKIKLEDTDTIEATLTVTMSIARWKELAAQLQQKYPSSQFYFLVTDLIRKITQQIETETPFESSR